MCLSNWSKHKQISFLISDYLMVQKFKGKKKIYIYISIFVNLEHPSHSDASFVPNLFLKGYKKYDSFLIL